jgi:tellurite resistance protein TerC
MSLHELLFFGGFIVLVLSLLLMDLGLFHKKSHIIPFKEALVWTIIWISFGIAFYVFLLFKADMIHGIESVADIQVQIDKYEHLITINPENFSESLQIYNKNLALEYITGYLVEYSLSVDNIFVMIMIFMAFGVSQKYYHDVLFWGIIGAIVMRFLFIFTASALIQNFAWILYVFGGFLIFTGARMFLNRNKDEKFETGKHPIVKFAAKYFAVFPRYVGKRFFIRRKGKRFITPLFIVLLVIEFTDVVFAVDSVPAIFSITKDPYIVFFSNIFAIIGLRSLFFLLINVMNIFHYLKVGLAALLTYIGVKMIFHHWLKEIGFKTSHSLYIIIGILALSIIASLIFPKKDEFKHAK